MSTVDKSPVYFYTSSFLLKVAAAKAEFAELFAAAEVINQEEATTFFTFNLKMFLSLYVFVH